MPDPNRNYIDANSAAELADVNIATIRRLCKKLLKSTAPEVKDVAFKKYELDSPRFVYMIDKDYVISHWNLNGSSEAPKSESSSQQVPSSEGGNQYMDRVLKIMESTVKTLEQQNKQLIDQNSELKEQNKQFYALLSEMNKRGFFLDAPKPAGADISGQATSTTDQPLTKEEPVSQPKRGFFSRLWGK